MKYRAVLFDQDGTLLDTLDDITCSYNNALRNLGFPGHSREKYRKFIGDGMQELARRVLPESDHDRETITRMMDAATTEYALHCSDSTCPYDGIPQLLDALSARGVKISILSNKADEFTKLMVKRALSGWKFEQVVGAFPDKPRKPDPSSALRIARHMDLAPSDFVYLGDSDVDMQTANAAGMYPVGALWGFRSAEDLRRGGARVLIQHPLELLRFFE